MPEIDISKYLEAVGGDVLDAYLKEVFPPQLLEIGFYTASNASEWLEIPKFMSFSAKYLQNKDRNPTPLVSTPSVPLPTPTPSASKSRSESTTSEDHATAHCSHSGPSQTCKETESSTPSGSSIVVSVASSDSNTRVETTVTSDTRLGTALPKKDKAKQKRKRESDDDSDIEVVKHPKTDTKNRTAKRKRTNKQKAVVEDDSDVEIVGYREMIRITRQLTVEKLITLTSLPTVWSSAKGVAYLLDLRGSKQTWIDAAGKPLAMFSIIKSQDQDAWGSGSAGSVKPNKCPEVLPLGSQRCQMSEYQCSGTFRCSEIDSSILGGYERSSPDEDGKKALFDAEREVNIADTSTPHHRAAAFYLDAMNKACPVKGCHGGAVYRKYKKKSFDGKEGFIGCDGWINGGKSNDHRFMPIPREVAEHLLVALFESDDGSFDEPINTVMCARVLSARSGAKGAQECPYTHIKDGKPVRGHLKFHDCDTKIKIYSPLEREDRRAIVIVDGFHNHPQFPSTKVSKEGKEKYAEAVRASGSRATVLNVDKATTTKTIFEGKSPAEFDPALGIARNRRSIAQQIRKEENPYGTELEGVLFKKRHDAANLPLSKRYIHEVISITSRKGDGGIDIIVTMLPGLAELVHSADATQHDNTYKRVFGSWCEWEIVVWDKRLNMRVTVARIYCNHETREAFEKMWITFWDTVESLTGRPVKFKFLDGEGLLAILVDGCKPQVDACGDALLKENVKRGSPVKETNPQEIVQFIVRTCDIHLERKLDDLAKTLPADVMERVRGFPFLETNQEVVDFMQFCENSDHKKLRDWAIDKKSAPWFVPSLNRFMSKIPDDDWHTTTGNTNLNESAHPFTNKHTGTNLKVLEAIKSAYDLDLSVEAKIKVAEETCILPNSHNTQAERDRSNRGRQHTRAVASTKRAMTANEVDLLNQEISALNEAEKSSKARRKELQEQKKNIQEANGLKKAPKKRGARGKARAPTDDDVADEDSRDAEPSSPPMSNYPTPDFAEASSSVSHHPSPLSSSHAIPLQPSSPSAFIPQIPPGYNHYGDLEDCNTSSQMPEQAWGTQEKENYFTFPDHLVSRPTLTSPERQVRGYLTQIDHELDITYHSVTSNPSLQYPFNL